MQVVCPNPGCGAVYTVSQQHIGKSFPCRACGTTVTVNAPPPGVAAPAAAPAVSANPMPESIPAMAAAPSSYPNQGRAMQQQLMSQVKGDLFTWMLGLGILIIGFFLFMAMLDNAKISRKQSKVEEGQLEQDKKDEYFRRRDRQVAEGVSGVTAPTSDERKARDKERATWSDTKADLQHEVTEARIGAGAWRYWYYWGAFVGAMLVTIAALAYVATGQTTTRRVTGAVVLVFMLVTFLGAMIGKGPAITISP